MTERSYRLGSIGLVITLFAQISKVQAAEGVIDDRDRSISYSPSNSWKAQSCVECGFWTFPHTAGTSWTGVKAENEDGTNVDLEILFEGMLLLLITSNTETHRIQA